MLSSLSLVDEMKFASVRLLSEGHLTLGIGNSTKLQNHGLTSRQCFVLAWWVKGLVQFGLI